MAVLGGGNNGTEILREKMVELNFDIGTVDFKANVHIFKLSGGVVNDRCA